MKLADTVIAAIAEAKGGEKVAIRRKKVSLKRKKVDVRKANKPQPKKPIRRTAKKVAVKKRAASTKKATPKRRPGTKGKAGKSVNSLEAGTGKLRKSQNRIGSVQLLELNPLSSNKQVIVKSQVFAMTPGAFPYQQTIVFSGVSFVDEKDKKHPLPVNLRNGNIMHAEELDAQRHPVQLRCSCFTGDTLIPLLNGKTVPIKDLVAKDAFRVYSFDTDTKKVVVGDATNCRLTEKGAKVVKVTFDNGSTLKCTPDHLFMLKGGEYKPVKDIGPEESLQALYRQESDSDLKGYEQYVEDGELFYTHRLADQYNWNEFLPQSYVRHHADFDKLNNDPVNIVRMHSSDHLRVHGEHNRKVLREKNPMWDAGVVSKVKETNIELGHYQAASKRMKLENPMHNKKSLDKMVATNFKNGAYIGAGYHFKASSQEVRERMREGKKSAKLKKFSAFLSTLNFGTTKLTRDHAALLGYKSNHMLSVQVRKAFKELHFPGFELNHVPVRTAEAFPGVYITREAPLNHKIVSIEDAGYEDVYCMTVEGHANFLVDADNGKRFGSGVFVHNCPDFKWTWAWYDAKQRALVGKRPEPYTRKTPPPPDGLPYRNPLKVAGICKHLIGVIDKLEANKLLT